MQSFNTHLYKGGKCVSCCNKNFKEWTNAVCNHEFDVTGTVFINNIPKFYWRKLQLDDNSRKVLEIIIPSTIDHNGHLNHYFRVWFVILIVFTATERCLNLPEGSRCPTAVTFSGMSLNTIHALWMAYIPIN